MTSPSREAFEAAWPRIVIPGEFDGMDLTDQSRWRGALLQAFEFGIQHARDVAVKALDDIPVPPSVVGIEKQLWIVAIAQADEAIKEALK